ncbi:hypothetical protein Tco_1436488 [Tanacetum coccineum]
MTKPYSSTRFIANCFILRIHKDGDGVASFQLKSDSLPHAHAQTTKTFYKHQDSRIMKAQELKTKTSVQALIPNVGCRLVPSCFVIFDLLPLSLSFDFVFASEIFKSLSFCHDRLCRLAILCLDQHAHTLHHLESLLTISLDRLDILKEDLVYQSLWKSLSLNLKLS